MKPRNTKANARIIVEETRPCLDLVGRLWEDTIVNTLHMTEKRDRLGRLL